jgi:hypothetical protein
MLLLVNRGEMLDTESQASYAEWSWPLKATGWFAHFGVLVPLAVIGVWATWADRRRLAIFYALTIAYAASVVLFYVFARYRFPLVPMLIILAAAGLSTLTALSIGIGREERNHGTPAPAAMRARGQVNPRASIIVRNALGVGPQRHWKSACGHAEPRTSESEARHQRKFAAGVGPRRQWKKLADSRELPTRLGERRWP